MVGFVVIGGAVPKSRPTGWPVAWIPVPALALQCLALLLMPVFYWFYLVHTEAERHAFLGIVVLEAAVLLTTAATFRITGRMIHQLAGRHEPSPELEDPSGLASNASFVWRYDYQASICQRYGNTLSVLAIGVDGFAQLSARWGRTAADQLERTMGRILRGNLRSMDLATRWGTGEFLVLLPETGSEGAWIIAERIRGVLGDLTPDDGAVEGPLSASFGIASFPDQHEASERLLDLAERAMHEARSAGGNRISSAPLPAR